MAGVFEEVSRTAAMFVPEEDDAVGVPEQDGAVPKMAEEDGGSEKARGLLYYLRTAAMLEEDGEGVLAYDVSNGSPS